MHERRLCLFRLRMSEPQVSNRRKQVFNIYDKIENTVKYPSHPWSGWGGEERREWEFKGVKKNKGTKQLSATSNLKGLRRPELP